MTCRPGYRQRARAAAVVATLLVASPAIAETLTNDSIVRLVRAGVGEAAVIAKIRATDTRFGVDTADILDLKREGVADTVITAMIEAGGRKAPLVSPDTPAVEQPPGFYLAAGTGADRRLIRMLPAMAGQARSSGILAYTLTGGMASMKMKATVPGSRATTRTSMPQPTFYFYAEPSGVVRIDDPMSLDLVRLVRFEVTTRERRAGVGSFNIKGTKTGIAGKDRIAFRYERIAPHLYRLSPATALPAGEYGFIYGMQQGQGVGLRSAGGITARVLDFGVDAAPANASDGK